MCIREGGREADDQGYINLPLFQQWLSSPLTSKQRKSCTEARQYPVLLEKRHSAFAESTISVFLALPSAIVGMRRKNLFLCICVHSHMSRMTVLTQKHNSSKRREYPLPPPLEKKKGRKNNVSALLLAPPRRQRQNHADSDSTKHKRMFFSILNLWHLTLPSLHLN